jgi:hypothetical protein
MRRTVLYALAILAVVFGAFAGQDTSSHLPKNYQTIFENSVVAIIHAHYAPHETVPVHDHSKFATVYVYLSDSGLVKFSHVEEHPFTTVRQPVKAGAYRVSPGRIERHSAENLGDIPTDFLRVELKQVPVRHFTQEFRAPAPASLSQDSDKVEFSNSDVVTERIICVVGSSCEIKAASSPSVIVVFTPAELSDETNDSLSSELKVGNVQWMDKGQPLLIKADSSVSAHVLRILFPSSRVSAADN